MKTPLLNRNRTFAGILLFGLLAMTARNAVDPDLWWHLRTGEWIMQTGHIPHIDPFSFTRAGSAWVSHEWLSEVIFFLLWKFGGAAALIVFSALITTAGFMLLYLRCPGKPAGAAAAVAVGALASAPVWGVRPQMFTFALASLLLWLVEAGEKRPVLLLWIPPLFVVWLNLHAGFALGPALLLTVALGTLWEVAAGQSAWQNVRRSFAHVALTLIACMALVPLNPSGAELYGYPLDVLRSTGMRSFITEWFAPDFHQWRYAALLLIWLAILVALAGSRTRPKTRVIAPLLLTFAAAMDAVRHIPIFVLVAAPILAAAVPVFSGPKSRPRAMGGQYPLIFRGTVLVLMAVFAMTRWQMLVRRQARAEAEVVPARAVDFLQTQHLTSRLFVYYDWGGYAIWRLYPEYRVFVDGRADLYGDAGLHQFQEIVQLRPNWRALLDSWGVQAVLVPAQTALSQALVLDANWQLSYHGDQAVVFVRNRTQGGVSMGRQVGPNHEKPCTETQESAKLRRTKRSFPLWKSLTVKVRDEGMGMDQRFHILTCACGEGGRTLGYGQPGV